MTTASDKCSSLKAALTLNTTVTAAHCPEVLWYDEVGAVCSREIQTYAQVQAQHLRHTHPLASQVAGAWG